jgi:hypothetical protein
VRAFPNAGLALGIKLGINYATPVASHPVHYGTQLSELPDNVETSELRKPKPRVHDNAPGNFGTMTLHFSCYSKHF